MSTPTKSPSPTGESVKLDDITYELDPEGDTTLVIPRVRASLPPLFKDLKSTALAGIYPFCESMSFLIFPTSGFDYVTLRLRVSSKHLILASGYYARMFRSGFREGTALRDNGHVEIPTEEPRGVAFLLLMVIIHHRTSQVPFEVSLSTLANMAVLVDYYDCYEAVALLSRLWITGMPDILPTALDPFPAALNANTWLFISWVFRNNSIFEKMTQLFITQSKAEIRGGILPTPRRILDKMNKQRSSYIARVIRDIEDLHSEVVRGCVCPLSRGTNIQLCTYAVLGALTKHMIDMQLSPAPQSPFSGLSIHTLLDDCRTKMQSPVIKDQHVDHTKCRLTSRINIALSSHVEQPGFDLDVERSSDSIPDVIAATAATHLFSN
ncbi:hypothetical protein BJX99DRAFT_193007 [Aspergillus californicus]